MIAGIAPNRLVVVLALLVASSDILFARSGAQSQSKYSFRFASLDAGSAILGKKDEFIERLSPFDRSARLKTDRAVSEAEFLQFVKNRSEDICFVIGDGRSEVGKILRAL